MNAVRDPARRDRGRPPRKRTRVLLIDDQRTARAALRAAISAQPDMTVAGEAETGDDGARAARDLQPDVAIVNVAVSAVHIAETVVPVARAHPRAVVLVVNLQDDLSFLGAALAAGAAECLVRKTSVTEVGATLQTIRRLAASATRDGGLSYDGPADPVLAQQTPASVLSARERQVLDLVAHGHTRREMAARLGVGVKTIDTYRARLIEKLGLRTRAALVRYALESGILRPHRASAGSA